MNKLIVTGFTVAALLGAIFVWSMFFCVKNSNKLACSTILMLYRNAGRPDEVKTNATARFYLYRDGTGVVSYKGAVATSRQTFMIDRDMYFTWKELEKGEFVQDVTKISRRLNDNTPDFIWSSYGAPGTRYYLDIEAIARNTWQISDRRYPIAICRSK